MTDRIALTVAEVSFLLAAVDPTAQSAVPTLLGISAEEQTDAVKAAGLASLSVRGLVAPAGQSVRLSAPAAAVAEGLTTATTIIQLGLVAADRADGTMLFDTGDLRFLIAPRANRCFDVTGLDRSRDIQEPLIHIIRTFLAEYRPAVASLRLEHAASSGAIGHRLSTPAVDPAPGFGWVTLAAGPDNVWSYADVSDQTVRKGDETEALARLSDVLGDLLALPTPTTADQT